MIKSTMDRFIHKWLRVPYALYVAAYKKPAKPQVTLVLIHGIGNTNKTWSGLVSQLPENVRVIAIDLLGFGQSPRPDWAMYDTKTQARSVIATLVKQRIYGKVIIVGHSLGSLVAIEVARRYNPIVSRLILCSPPLYKTDQKQRENPPIADKTLRRMYAKVIKHPSLFLRLARLAKRYRLSDKTSNINNENLVTYMATLEAAIINQTSLADAQNLRLPITVIRGRLDPLVVPANLKALASSNSRISLKTISTGHELNQKYFQAILSEINLITTKRQ